MIFMELCQTSMATRVAEIKRTGPTKGPPTTVKAYRTGDHSIRQVIASELITYRLRRHAAFD